ncbi:MAG: hypothetical protein L6R37_005235 [Teloschistes peruensis]|nr:MAG: hypothetical protein L6R37_005235 [Teloschistes peruensis]
MLLGRSCLDRGQSKLGRHVNREPPPFSIALVVLTLIYIYKMCQNRYDSNAATQQRSEELKNHYKKRRDDFRNDPRSSLELEAWRNQDNDVAYNLLNGTQKSFVPPGLVGKASFPECLPWSKCDTFFSEYPDHNPDEFILSRTKLSYIIGNLASYDSRQYPLSPNDKRPEGQGFCHTLVIPSNRVYNVVDPNATADNCELLYEMHKHFVDFWQTDQGKEKILARAKRAIDDQDKKLRNAPAPPSNSQGASPVYDEATRKNVFDHFDKLKEPFKKLEAKDFRFAFHVFPDNSIGHLHMHVFPHQEMFREVSTKVYDWKTVPLDAILEVERA